MYFEIGDTYHIYNQGNNRRQIFFGDDNYGFFFKKMVYHIKPYGDFVRYCLMPNHFHWLFQVHRLECPPRKFLSNSKNSEKDPIK
ncbi:MAG: transposase [Saprospiraceae bacterium]|nr:transposase [Saprospiraceae bacterium]